MLCEEDMTIIEARNALSMPQNTKHATLTKTLNNIRKIGKHCINYGMTNHNVETCKKKNEQTTMAIIEASQPSQKPHNTFSYACHIYGSNGHKMIDCPKFVEMQKLFHGKYVAVV
jgi:hypothetical protein